MLDSFTSFDPRTTQMCREKLQRLLRITTRLSRFITARYYTVGNATTKLLPGLADILVSHPTILRCQPGT